MSSSNEQIPDQQVHSPTTTPVATPGTDNTHRDDNLPEVYVDDSPQAIHGKEYCENNEPKFPVAFDDGHKTFVPERHEALGDVPFTAGDAGKEVVGDTDSAEPTPNEKKRRICGLTRKMFFIILVIVIIIVIAAAVGGGVGGSMASRNPSDKDKSEASAPTSSEAPSNTAPSPPKPTTEFLNNQTSPSDVFSFQGFSADNYEGDATQIIHEEGGTDFPYIVNSYVWLPNTTSCCISFCNNATAEGYLGWWCDAKYQKDTTRPFKRLYVWCGLDREKENARCV